ncbi:nSTAND1 domain-containing NTPase [Nannocystis radixulma]|uniref:SUMF1/EgtB/PvdO family nonheme iron enzyme n=1 Tax=Nannocystis radixulma TaxID=2995305 RepID=A0ABT5BAW7_9BACT|nr:SUMF1/EgtB/PvdO family nonheme iron enzyme [Nannocystis radixulma]MDC0671274.1 SUMF1/EgtB/PvdO family nonheme iron enzyme [Nannocystis radixulma]
MNAGEWTLPQQFDEYRLVRVLGSGSMGVVFLGHDTILDRPVAIKFINARDANPRTRERFVIEARAAARIAHPNVMAIHRIGELEGRLYIISEYVRGEPLSEIRGALPWQEALTIAVGLARGLAAAHRQGVLHRDIKLANVMRNELGEVKLLDFGLAKLVPQGTGKLRPDAKTPLPAVIDIYGRIGDTQEYGSPRVDVVAQLDSTMTGRVTGSPADEESSEVIVGTPYYMAPELWRAESATRSSDIYALGALLYILCAGHPPLEASSTLELARLSQESAPRALQDVAPGVDGRFAKLIDRCLARSPAARFASADELCTALELLLTTGPIAEVIHGNPYRGLQAFEARHRAVFFGRVAEIRAVVDRLRVQSFVLVAGDSGVGKSSLCRAGVLPQASEPPGVGGRTWSSVAMIPGRRPLQTLVSALASHFTLKEEALRTLLMGEPEGLVRLLARRQGKDRGFILFIDQLEELVTLSEAPQVEPFGRFLTAFASGVPSLRLLASVRGDFLTRAAALPLLGPFINPAVYLLTPLTREGMREAIVGPAALQGVHFESEGLVDEVIQAGVEGSLPLLQFALAELWEAREAGSKIITADDLEKIGRVTGALARHADNVVAGLPPSQRIAVRRLLMRLVTIEDTRASLPLEDLVSGDPASEAALEALVRGRLVVAREAQDGTVHEIAHEALIRNWGTLQRWINEERESREVRHRLEQAAVEWQRLGHGRIGLWTAEQLMEADRLEAASLRAREREFLAASAAEQRRRLWLRRAMVATLPLVAGLAFTGVKVQEARALASRVDDQLARARQAFADAHAHDLAAETSRVEALRKFDARDVPGGEEEWAHTQQRFDEADRTYKEAIMASEVALGFDPAHAEARRLVADALYERALLAEERHEPELAEELIARLKLYDDGSRQARWSAPASLSVAITPDDASVKLSRYERDDAHRWVLVDPHELGSAPVAPLELAAGSYLLEIAIADREPIFYPVLLRRAEERRLLLDIPQASSIPAGFAFVAAGASQFGSADEDTIRRKFFFAAPQHEVVTGSYVIARRETSYRQWIAFLDDLPAAERARRTPGVEADKFHVGVRLEPIDNGWRLVMKAGEATYVARAGETLKYAGREALAEQDWLDMPVSAISWDDAQAYLAWLDRTGRVRGARLCSEWEWERAARGADGRNFPHADTITRGEANYDETYARVAEHGGPDVGGAHPGSRSPFGVDDLVGNVWEWTTSSLADDEGIIRGGAYYYDEVTCRSVNRYPWSKDTRDSTLGLRVCASIATDAIAVAGPKPTRGS